MNGGKTAWVVVLAACGRLGFQAAGMSDDDVVGNAIRLVVTSDEYLGEPAGLPIPDATVLIERGGAVERVTTDDEGTATFSSEGVTAYHIIYQGDIGWRIYTVSSPHAGTVELGGRTAFNLNRSMTLVVPPGTGSGSSTYSAQVPDRCALLPQYGAPTFTFDFNPDCEGQSIRLIAFRLTSGVHQYIDAGTVTLTHGSTLTVTGTYQAAPVRTIELFKLPSGTSTLYADIVARTGTEFTRLTTDHPSIATMGQPGGTVVASAAPGGDALYMQAWYDLPLAYSSTSERLEPATIEDNTVFDGSGMLPLFTSLVVDGLTSVSWTGGGTGGTMIALEATAGMLQWNAYTEPTATSLRFPVIPSDLAVPRPTSFAVVSVTKLDVPGTTAADVARTFDRTWIQWPSLGALQPATGSSRARIQYIVGL